MAKTLFWGKTSCDDCGYVMHDAQVYHFDSQEFCLTCYYLYSKNVRPLV
jgi:formylmethanofuran dehydrogenase subunit E